MSEKTRNSRAAAGLRSVTRRLASSSTKQLPVLVPQVVQALPDCRSILSSPGSSTKDSPDAVVLHRFKTQISTLLTHRSPEARFGAIILIKATVELGGHGILATSGHWVRGILNVLNKPDPLSTKRLCVITLTRIFALTHGDPALLREITTPSLPTFITTCLNSANPKGSNVPSHFRGEFFQTVLCSFSHLIPNHPTVFRSFQAELQTVLTPFLASTTSDIGNGAIEAITISPSPEIVDAARTLFSLLHFCTPKSGASDEFTRVFAALITETHETVDQVFRAVIEDWQSVAGVTPQQTTFEGEPSGLKSNIGLPEWNGIYSGCERLHGLLALLENFIYTRTAGNVVLPLGPVVDLLIRICNTTVPSSKENDRESFNVELNKQISSDEREALFSQLPSIHAAAIRLMDAFCERLGAGIKPFHHTFLELVSWVFRYENYNESMRASCYATISSILDSSGGGLSKEHIQQVTLMIESSCKDLLSNPSTVQDPQPTFESALNGAVGDKSTSKSARHAVSNHASSELVNVAADFLTALQSRVPAERLQRSLRSTLDQAAILGNHTRLMLASVLNPSRHKGVGNAYSSILPHLARSNPEALEVEGLIRPRMPAVSGGTNGFSGGTDEEDGSESVDNPKPKDEGDDESMDELQQNMPLDHDAASHNPAEQPEASKIIRFPTVNPSLDTSNAPPRATRNISQNEIYRKADELNPESVIMKMLRREKREPPEENLSHLDPKRQRIEPHDPELGSQLSSVDFGEPASLAQPIVVGEPSDMRNPQEARKPIEADDMDNDEDFVIPELTLEPDTEDEDQSE